MINNQRNFSAIKACKKLKSVAAVSENNEPKIIKPTIKTLEVINTGLLPLERVQVYLLLLRSLAKTLNLRKATLTNCALIINLLQDKGD